MPKSQLISKHQFIFNTLLDNLLLQCTVKSNFTGSNFVAVHTCIDALNIILTIIPDVRLRQSLRQLQEQLPNPEANQAQAIFESWWQIKQLVWTEELNVIIFLYRNIQYCYYDNLSNSEILKCYYKANKLLIDCLSRNHELTITLCRELEAVMLSSEAELSQR